jgi:ATP-dependent helicase/nuclease subunit A
MDGNRRRRPEENPGPALPRLPFDEGPDTISRRDEVARQHATDPRRNVVLEASAGTGKTTVLVNRYLNLLKAGVDPRNVLAITFTRKAAAEMRQRIVRELQQAASLSAADAARWHDLRDRLGDIAISTIDAFCLSLLREFPLEAGLDPGFDMADDTLVARVKEDALDRALAICRRLAVRHEDVRLLVAQLGEGRLRHGLGRLLDRRLVARGLLRRFTPGAPSSAEEVCRTIADRFAGAMDALPGGLDRFLEDGPRLDRRFQLVAADLRYLAEFAGAGRARSDQADAMGRTSSSPADRTQPARPVPAGDVARARAALDGIRHYFLTRRGEPRKKLASGYDRDDFPSPDAFQRHVRGVASLAPPVADLLAAFQGDLNRVLARGVKRAFEIASYQFRRQLEAHAVLDFPELLGRTLALLGRMDEFSQSRYRLEARYHHVLVDEFQDTSRAQWRLVSLLVKSWGEGAGLAGGALPPSIFVVGDRKQSIYGFRDAEATILGRARRDIEALRPQGRVRRSISRSFRSAPALLSFANDLFACVDPGTRADRFRFGRRDTFPVGDVPPGEARLGLIVADGIGACAAGVAAEIARLLGEGAIVRDPRTGAARAATHGDVAILFRSREGHQEYERALVARGIPAYVYKGLGFFDADETKDLLALVDYLAHPDSDVAAAALLRSRLVRISDCALRHLAPGIAAALRQAGEPGEAGRLDAEDARVLAQARRAVATWLPLVDQLTPAEVVDRALDESAYAYELRGPRRVQARENVKKVRALMRRIQNGGYATLADLAGHLRTLSAGDESNAAVDAIDAVNLMTVHAAKGLEFPIVFLVNLSRGTGGGRDPIRVAHERGTAWVSIGDFTSDADDQAPERDVEETKRLLYVAVTRARDRLYLSSPLRDGHFAPRRGSLGSVLPASLTALFDREPAASPSIVGWRGPSGRSHEIRVSPAAGPAAIAGRAPIAFAAAAVPAPRDAFGHLACDAAPRVAVTMMSSEPESAVLQADLAAGFATAEEQPVLGLLVHRLFQYLGHPDVSAAREDLVRRARALIGPPELPVPDEEATTLVERAVEALEAICRDSRIEPLLREGRWLHEVPFSMVQGGLILRGVIDSLVEHADGVTVVEIKTGRTRPEHQRQLDVYRAAAEMLFPGRAIRGVLVYAGHVA